jgi:hypothetical protein
MLSKKLLKDVGVSRLPVKTDVWRKYTAAFWSYSAAMDGRMALRFE